MAEVVWTKRALGQVGRIREYVAQDSPRAADDLAHRLLSATDTLREFPYLARTISKGRRELTTVYPYLIRYRVERERVRVTEVRHGARRPN